MEEQQLLTQFIEEDYQRHRRELEASEESGRASSNKLAGGGRNGQKNEPNPSRE
jgi:hypothetical protein